MVDPPPNIVRVEDIGDPRVAVYREQKDQWLRARHRPWLTGSGPREDATGTGLMPGDLFMAEGDKVVAQLIASPHEVVSVLVSEHRLGAHLPFLAGLGSDVPVYVIPRGIVDGLAGFEIHRGLLACGRRVDPGPPAALLAGAGAAVLLEDLANHDNVGGIFRSVRALSSVPACVLLSPRCCDPLYRKALRVSMGNALHVPFQTLEPWPAGLRTVAAAGHVPLALTPAEDAVDLADLRLSPGQRPALLLGTEGPGLRAETLRLVRDLGGLAVRIPINAAADSLNVGVAAAIAMHWLFGQPGSAG